MSCHVLLLLLLSQAADAPMEEDEEDEDYINLLDGSAPEGLYQVTLARAEAAVPLEDSNKPGGEGKNRCVCVHVGRGRGAVCWVYVLCLPDGESPKASHRSGQ